MLGRWIVATTVALASGIACDFEINGTVTPHGTDGAEGTEGSGAAETEDDPTTDTDESDTDAGLDETGEDALTGEDSGSGGPFDPGTGLVVFVTTASYSGAMGGAAGADAICQTEADAALLPGTYRAWLSDSSEHAIDRITGNGPWFNTIGQTVFNNAAGLQVGPLDPIGHAADGSPSDGLMVWTGTGDTGIATPPFCGEWATPAAKGTVGAVGLTGQPWTEADVVDCDELGHLYCFEVEDPKSPE